MSPAHLDFVTAAFQVTEFNRQECGIAQSQAKSPVVKSLAADFLKEANDFDAQLAPIAASAGIKRRLTPPPTGSGSDRAASASSAGQVRQIIVARTIPRALLRDRCASRR